MYQIFRLFILIIFSLESFRLVQHKLYEKREKINPFHSAVVIFSVWDVRCENVSVFVSYIVHCLMVNAFVILVFFFLFFHSFTRFFFSLLTSLTFEIELSMRSKNVLHRHPKIKSDSNIFRWLFRFFFCSLFFFGAPYTLDAMRVAHSFIYIFFLLNGFCSW